MTASVGVTRAWSTAHPSSFRVELLHQEAPTSRQTSNSLHRDRACPPQECT